MKTLTQSKQKIAPWSWFNCVLGVLALVLFWSEPAHSQVLPFSPTDDEPSSNDYEYQYRLIDAENALSLGQSAARRGDTSLARDLFVEAVKTFELNDSVEGMARGYMNLGFLAEKEDNPRESIVMIRNAARHYRDASKMEETAKVIGYLGGLFDRYGRRDLACKAWDTAYEYYQRADRQTKASLTLELSEVGGCPEVVRRRSEDDVFPDPVRSVSEVSDAVARVLGPEPMEILVAEGEEDGQAAGDLLAEAQQARGAGASSLISDQNLRVLTALREDALRGTAQSQLAAAENDELTVDERLNAYSSAISIYGQLNDDADRRSVSLAYARFASQELEYDEAEVAYQELLVESQPNDEPGEVEIRRELSDLYAQKGQYVDAIDQMRLIMNLHDEAGADVSEQLASVNTSFRFAQQLGDVNQQCEFLRNRLSLDDQADFSTDGVVALIEIAQRNCDVPSQFLQESSPVPDSGLARVERTVASSLRVIAGRPRSRERIPSFFDQLERTLQARESYKALDRILGQRLTYDQDSGDVAAISRTIGALYNNAVALGDSRLVSRYQLRQRTAELDVTYADSSPADLGNLGLDAAQSGDVEIACYFWTRAFNEYRRLGEEDLLGVVNVLRNDYGCPQVESPDEVSIAS